jgi:hypothetical protein
MKRTRSMSAWLVAWLFAGLIFASFTLPSHAQSAKEARVKPQPYYDITKEVTLSGTISSVIEKWSPDMTMPGAHLLLSTSTGVVDASLGKFGLEGRGALSVKAGQSVEVTGVMKTLKEKQVFVARTVTFGGQVYTMRNKHGVAVSAQGRERASRLATQKGASL